MKLNGNSKELFEKWYTIVYLKHSEKYFNTNKYYVEIDLRGFWLAKQDSERYGVLVDFFDSINIDVDAYMTVYSTYFADMNTKEKSRTMAIEKANAILNEKI